MKIVLTGGSGLIGNALGSALTRNDSVEIHVLARHLDSARPRLAFPCQIWSWDQAAEALSGADILIHLAGENIASRRWTAARKQELRNSRVETAETLRRALKTPLKAVISASGIGYYGDRGSDVLTEQDPPGEDFLANLCQEWESAVEKIASQRHVHFRLGVVLAEGGGFLEQVAPLFARVGASRLGHGRQYFSWIHIEDAVQAIVKATQDEHFRGAINLTAPRPVSNAELTSALACALQASSAPPVPGLALKLIYGELSQALLGSQRAHPKRLEELGYQFRFSQIEPALAAIYPEFEPGEMLSVFQQWVPAGINDLWEFFSSESNLERITPPFLNFKVIGKTTPKIQLGTEIDYRLKVHGLPVHWRTRIREWNPRTRFTDQQLRGPYTKWEHVHTFETLGRGVRLVDRVRWKLPLGRMGRLAAYDLVSRDIQQIFSYRAKIIDQIFYSR